MTMRRWIVQCRIGDTGWMPVGIFRARSAGGALAQALAGAFRDIEDAPLQLAATPQED